MDNFDIRDWKKKMLLKESIEEAESQASMQAKKKGLVSAGWGRWKDKKGNVVAKTENGKLVPIKGDEKGAVAAKQPKKPVNIFDKPGQKKPVAAPVVAKPNATKSVAQKPAQSAPAQPDASSALLAKFKPPKRNPFKVQPEVATYGDEYTEQDVMKDLKQNGMNAGGYIIRTTNGDEAFTENGAEVAYALKVAKKKGLDGIWAWH